MSDSYSKYYEDIADYNLLCKKYNETPVKDEKSSYGESDPYCEHAQMLEDRQRKENG